MLLYNSIGILIDSKQIDFIPYMSTLNKNCVFVSSDTFLYCWQFKTFSFHKYASLFVQKNQERGFHIDDMSVIGMNDDQFVTDFKLSRYSC